MKVFLFKYVLYICTVQLINIKIMESKTVYDLMVKGLTKAKVPCRITLSDSMVIIQCGWNYPDRIFHKIAKVAEKNGINFNGQLSVCADSTGHKTIETKTIEYGPKRY